MTRLVATVLVSLVLCQAMATTTAKSPKDFHVDVESLKEIEPAFGDFQGDMYAGVLPIRPPSPQDHQQADRGNLMFWLYQPDSCSVPDSMVVWLNGGPGCSSFGGMLFENAPVTIPHYRAGYFGTTENEPLIANPYAWTKATTMLYVEQPAGTGFSTGPEPDDEGDVSRDFYYFLQNFYTVFPELREKRLFFFGESYAGMYVPAIAHKIHKENKAGTESRINLAGIALGNGWVDANVQGPMVIDYAWWHGMIDTTTKHALHAQWTECAKMGIMPDPYHAFTIPDECGLMGVVLEAAGAGAVDWGTPNTYDVTTWDGYPILFNQNGTFDRFFNKPKVQDLLHAPPMEWLQCIPGSGRRRRRLLAQKERELLMLDHDRPESMIPYMADLLDDAKIRVVVYNGDRDLSTCSQGSEVLLDSMNWTGHDDWHDPYKARRGLWLVEDGNIGGYAKPLKNLDFIVVANSGHLAPMNQPVNALDLVTRVLSGKSFVDKELPIFDPPKAKTGSGQKAEVVSKKIEGHKSVARVAFVAALCGFIAGAVSVLGWSIIVSHQRATPQYDRIGDVEVESLS